MLQYEWKTIDVHYNKDEQKLADKRRKYLEKLGYDFQQTDTGGFERDYCDQYIDRGKFKNVL